MTINVINSWRLSISQFQVMNDLCKALNEAEQRNNIWAFIYCSIIHQIWKAGNAKRHGKQYQIPRLIAATILESLPHAAKQTFWEYWNTTQPDRLCYLPLWCPLCQVDQR